MSDFRGGYPAGTPPNGRPPPPRSSQSYQRAHAPPPPQDQFTRPFSLYEALPYSPFTSIAPFNSGALHLLGSPQRVWQLSNNRSLDIIPIPNLGSASPATCLTNAVDTSDFDALNAEVRDGQPASRLLEQSVAIVSNLVNPRQVPE